jgi:starvation-inducible DNA-binding protein
MKKENPSVLALNRLLADYSITSQNARFCHWNVIGPVFEDNHEIFGEIYDMFADQIDIFAEQVRILGEYPMSGFAEYLKETSLKEYSGVMSAADMQKALHADLLLISDEMTQFINETDNDACTQDVIIAAKKDLDKKRWMLRAMLGKK